MAQCTRLQLSPLPTPPPLFREISSDPTDIAAARAHWESLGECADPSKYESHGRDLVAQLLYGHGWRVTGEYTGVATRTLYM